MDDYQFSQSQEPTIEQFTNNFDRNRNPVPSEPISKLQSRNLSANEEYSNMGLHYNYDHKQYPASTYFEENERAVESRSTIGDERGASTPAFDEKQGSGSVTGLHSTSPYG